MNDSAWSRSLPGWLTEAAEVLAARRRVIIAAGVGLVLFGAVVALVAPSLLPPRPIVGAAVGLAAVLLAAALGLAVDAADLVVRGRRHVKAAGAEVAAVVGRDPQDVDPLMALVDRHAVDGYVNVAIAPTSAAGVPGARAAALAEALAHDGRRVLLVDLTRGETPAAGLSDVIRGDRRLADVARFEDDVFLARVAIGSDPDAALSGFAGWVEHLPTDLEILIAALPPLAEPGVLAAATAADAVLIQVEVDRTERVDLIASLDAVDAAGLTAELVLVDPTHRPDRDAVVGTGGGDVLADGVLAVEEPAPDERPIPADTASDEMADDLAGDPASPPPPADALPASDPDPDDGLEDTAAPEDRPAAEPTVAADAPTAEIVLPPDAVAPPVAPAPDVTPRVHTIDVTDPPTGSVRSVDARGSAASDRHLPDPSEDELDRVAEEAARRTAALQQLARRAWSREDRSRG